MAEKSSFVGKKSSFKGEKSSFKLFGKPFSRPVLPCSHEIIIFHFLFTQAFFVLFEGNLILSKSLKLDFSLETQFFSHETRFFGHFAQILHFMMDFRGKFEWGDPFYAIFINKIFGKRQKSAVFNMNLENPSNNEEICFQK